MTPNIGYSPTEIRLIARLFHKMQNESEEESYLYKLSKEVKRSLPTTIDNLEKLEKKEIVKSASTGIRRGKRGPVRIYSLTPYGERLAQVLLERNGFTYQLLRKQGIV